MDMSTAEDRLYNANESQASEQELMSLACALPNSDIGMSPAFSHRLSGKAAKNEFNHCILDQSVVSDMGMASQLQAGSVPLIDQDQHLFPSAN